MIFAKNKLLTCLLVFLLPPAQAQSSQEAMRWGKCTSAGVPAPVAKQNRKPTMTKLADNVYTFRFYDNTLIVVGDDGVLITDTHNHVHAALLKQELKKITDKPVTKIVLSHEHFDHIGGTRVFADAKIIAQKNILPFLIFDPLDRAPDKIDVTFDKELTVDMGTTKVDLKYWGQTEGVANIVVHLPREKIALLSDLHSGGRSLIDFLGLSDTNMLGLRLVLNEVAKWDLKYVVDSHSPGTDPNMVREYAAFLNDLHDTVYSAVKKELDAVLPVATDENGTTDPLELYLRMLPLADSIELPKYKDWGGYEEELSSNVLWMASSILYGAL